MKKYLLLQIAFSIGLLVFSQTASAQWTAVNSGLTNHHVNCLAVSGGNIIAGTDSGLFLFTIVGNNWTNTSTGFNSNEGVSLAVKGDTIFAGTAVAFTYDSAGILESSLDGGVFRSTDNGTSWTNLVQLNYPVISLSVTGSGIFAGTGGNGILFSTNNGTSWASVSPECSNRAGFSIPPAHAGNVECVSNLNVSCLAMNGNTILAGTLGYGVLFSIGTFSTSMSWTYNNDQNPKNWNVNSIAVSGNNIFAGTDSGIFISSDTGRSWTAFNTGLPANPMVNSIVICGTDIFIGTDGGVFLLSNNGTSWTAVSSGLTNDTITSLSVNSSNIFAGTPSAGVWHRPLSEMVSATNNKQQVLLYKSTALNLIASTQSNHNVAISFFLAKSQPVTLKIYNISGREIALLVNKYLGAGEQRISWDTKNLAPGCYTVRMQAGSNIYVKNISVSR
jgi:hypothetical protein